MSGPNSSQRRPLKLVSLFINLLFSLLLLVQVTSAAPAKRADLTDASVAFWRSKIFKDKLVGKTCVFYFKASETAKPYARGTTNKITIWDLFDEATYMNWNGDYLAPWKTVNRERDYFRAMSQVVAESCSGVAEMMFLDTNVPNEPEDSIWTTHEFTTIRGELYGALPSGVTRLDRIDGNGNFVRTIWTKPASLDIKNKKMRIMPLGDSITVGYPQNPSNSYRKRLLDLLNVNGNTITYVGSQSSGDFSNPRHEGESGANIATISSNADRTLSQRPNVILLHAGTNDLGSDADASGAPGRLATLIDKLVNQCPDAAVMVARIIHPSGDPARESRTQTFNDALYEIVRTRRATGAKVYITDQYSTIQPSDIQDNLHPTVAGYNKMGDVWNLALKQVVSLGWINDPVAGTAVAGNKQKCTGRLFWYGVGQIANGAGLGKALYPGQTCEDYIVQPSYCSCTPIGGGSASELAKPASGKCSDLNEDNHLAVHFADLNGDGLDEYIWVGPNGEATAFVNGGKSNDGKILWHQQAGQFAGGVGGRRSEIRFADLNNDGRAEYLWVHPDGSVDVWLNQKKATETSTQLDINWWQQTRSAGGIRRDGLGVRFADLNGDGRSEYIYVDDIGALTVYLNGGGRDGEPGNIGWIPQDQSASGVGGVRNNTVLADIDGDSRADYLKVSRTNGAVTEWRNSGSRDAGPNAGVISWDLIVPDIAGGIGSSGKGLTFGAVSGTGRADYLDVDPNTSAVNAYFNGCDLS